MFGCSLPPVSQYPPHCLVQASFRSSGICGWPAASRTAIRLALSAAFWRALATMSSAMVTLCNPPKECQSTQLPTKPWKWRHIFGYLEHGWTTYQSNCFFNLTIPVVEKWEIHSLTPWLAFYHVTWIEYVYSTHDFGDSTIQPLQFEVWLKLEDCHRCPPIPIQLESIPTDFDCIFDGFGSFLGEKSFTLKNGLSRPRTAFHGFFTLLSRFFHARFWDWF